MVCISCLPSIKYDGILFFDLPTSELKYKYNYGLSYINYIDCTFYASDYANKKFYLFDSNGCFIEEILFNADLREHLPNGPSGAMIKYKQDLYIVNYYSKKFLKFIE